MAPGLSLPRTWRAFCRTAVLAAALFGEPGHASEAERAVASVETGTPRAPHEESIDGDSLNGDLDLAFAGDMNFGRSLGQKLLADPAHDPFAAIDGLWAKADLRFANLESVIADLNGETESKTKRLVFAGPPSAAEVLRRARVDVVSTANNHAWDYGRKALLETLDHLDRAGVGHVGSGSTFERALVPFVTTLRGRRIAILAFTGVWNQGRLSEHPAQHHVADGAFRRIEAEVARYRSQVDLLFVSYHGGEEYSDVPVEYVLRAARVAMDAGADGFLGHHPHVPEGIEFVGGRPIFYSLGNFVFAKVRSSPWSDLGVIARISHSKTGKLRVRACPLTIGSYLPSPLTHAPPTIRAESLRHLQRLSRRFGSIVGGTFDDEGCLSVAPLEARSRTTPKGHRVGGPE